MFALIFVAEVDFCELYGVVGEGACFVEADRFYLCAFVDLVGFFPED